MPHDADEADRPNRRAQLEGQDQDWREIERQRAAILDNIPDMAWLKDAQSRYITVNQRFLEVYRLRSVEGVVGRTDFDFSPADLAEAFRSEDLDVVRTGRPRRMAERLVVIRGETYCFETLKAPIIGTSGETIGTVGIAHDVTERRQREQELREAEWQRRAILDNIQDIAWLKDREGRFIAVNQRGLDFFGVERSDVIGRDDFAVFPRELAEHFRADEAEVIRTGKKRVVEERHVDVDGEVRWLETIKAPVFGESGSIIGTTGTARDITDRKRRTEQLLLTNEELERRVDERTSALAAAQGALVRREKLAVLGQLAGGVAHQIRNPLAAIMNATYVLQRQVRLHHADVDDAIRIIREEIRHVNVIITGLLDYARVRAPLRNLTSVAHVIERVVGAEWMPKTVRVELRVETVPLLSLDADQIQDAVFNVVRNAVEAMNEAGVLSADVTATNDAVVLAITDSGPGISPQVRARLFEPLYTSKPLGIGLGLVTARTLVEAHGGRIVTVDVAQGARFEIHLPLSLATPAPES